MAESVRELIVFPTELALRRYQQNEALMHGCIDASGHTTLARLLTLCIPYAEIKGRRMDAARKLLMRRQVVEVASGHFAGQGTLGELSENALGGVLDQLISELSMLPDEADRIIDWMLDHHRKHKLYQLGTLMKVWQAVIRQEGLADPSGVNRAVLKLLKGNRRKWPPLLRDCRQLRFRSVRWFNPFEESCVAALNQRLKVRVESALPDAHAEIAEDRLGQRIRSEIMAEPWAFWAEDLSDALAVDSADVVQVDDFSRIHFSRSAGPYGEIEDLARRIGWMIQYRAIPPDRIALIVPNIGTVQDIIPHVFSRFRIPYYFRRGRPVLSSPCVKAFFAWLAFPLRPERDVLIDLVRNPSIHFTDREEAVEDLLNQPPIIELGDLAFFHGSGSCSGRQALTILQERIVEPEDHFNTEALKAVESTLEKFGHQPMPLGELIDLVEELLENTTLRPRESHEHGVWILNPQDAVGLSFDMVLFAGLNEGEFPAIPQQDALLSDRERNRLKGDLMEQGRHLPRLALPEASVLFEQQSVLFLTALGMAREQLVFSCQAVDREGRERNGSEYYLKLWSLAGWPAQTGICISPYDQWRIGQLGDKSAFAEHIRIQQKSVPDERVPMPGESFLPVIPLPLCRAEDEALQAAVWRGTDDPSVVSIEADDIDAGSMNTVTRISQSNIEHLMTMLKIEAERDAFLDSPVSERSDSVYCGHVASLKGRIAEWFDRKQELSPTALEALARCRYIFLLERIFGIREAGMRDDLPDPLDRGSLIHAVLREIYTAIASGKPDIDAPRFWAVKTAAGWMRRTEAGVDAVPLVYFDPVKKKEYVAFARETAQRLLDQNALGHPGVWAAEREKILEIVLNMIRYDAQTCAKEGRFPALFEHTFGRESAVDLGHIKLHGMIDRVDLIFADTGRLKKIRVLDYKGSSRSHDKQEDYLDEIRRNLDCQLPVYAFAAQCHFFGTFNTPEVNAQTEAVYMIYERDFSKIEKSLSKRIIPMDTPDLTDEFLSTLTTNIRRLKAGDFSVDPLIESYTDYRSVCRTEAVRREELE